MSDLITPELVTLDQDLGTERSEVIRHLVQNVVSNGRATGFDELYADAMAREQKTATGVPGGIAIPHCRSASVTTPSLAMARLKPPVDWGAKDGPADIVFFIAPPEGADQEHLQLLAKLARSLIRKDFTASLRSATSPVQIVELVDGALGLGPAPAEAGSAAGSGGGSAAGSGGAAAAASEVITATVSDLPLNAEHAHAAAWSPECGAVVGFSGIVRNHDGGRDVRSLGYSAHPTASAVIAGVAARIAEKYDGVRLWAAHRTGPLEIGDAALVAAVASAHRGTAFAACSELVDTVKARVPIWKEQGFSDGTSEWVGVSDAPQ